MSRKIQIGDNPDLQEEPEETEEEPEETEPEPEGGMFSSWKDVWGTVIIVGGILTFLFLVGNCMKSCDSQQGERSLKAAELHLKCIEITKDPEKCRIF